MNIVYTYQYDSPIGVLTIASNGEDITALWLKNIECSEKTVTREVDANELPVLSSTKEWLAYYFDGKEPGFMPSIKTDGNKFRELVWKLLREIPYGRVVTYGDIAKRTALELGKAKMSAQAVGGAIGSNPVSILIPCHRVVGANGNLTGYGGGIEKKVQLLQLEGIDMSKFYLPR